MKAGIKIVMVLIGIMMISLHTNKLTAQDIHSGVKLVQMKSSMLEGKLYINASLVNKSGNNIIVLEKSTDGIKYEWIAAWDGIQSPDNESLLYSYVDEKINSDCTYRFSIIENSGINYLGYYDLKHTSNIDNLTVTPSLIANGN